MNVFIATVLILAGAQSICKMTLSPRRWEFIEAILLAPLPLIFEQRIAGLSLKAVNARLATAATLENWCTLVVIQELFSLVVGFALISDFADNADRVPRLRKIWWKIPALIPSFLLPAGVFQLQINLFNALPGTDFRTISWWLVTAIPAAVILAAELIRLVRRKPDSRIVLTLHTEYLLLMSAIFLPVAARAKLMPVRDEFAWRDPLLLLGVLLAACAAGALLCFGLQTLKRTLKRKRKYGNCHPNP